MFESACTLFQLAEAGEESFVTSEAVVAEVVFILSSRRHSALPRPEVAALIRPIFGLRGCALRNKSRVTRALDLWVANQRVSFVDALMAAYAMDLGVPLATFDRALAEVPGLSLWQPPNELAPPARPSSK
jgi:predicted nucleic acid-binding protein